MYVCMYNDMSLSDHISLDSTEVEVTSPNPAFRNPTTQAQHQTGDLWSSPERAQMLNLSYLTSDSGMRTSVIINRLFPGL